MGKRDLNLPTKDAVIIYIAKKDGQKVKAFEIAKHFNIYEGRPFGPADASRDIGDFLAKCADYAEKEYEYVFGSSRHGHYLFKTEQSILEYEEYMEKKAAGILKTKARRAAKARKQIKNPLSALREIGLLN